MCTILIAHQVSSERPLLVLANRDEFYDRPTAAMAEWQEMPSMFAGRDLASGGTWFGARHQRWASITNVREGVRDSRNQKHQKSRGWLVADYLQGNLSPSAYLQEIAPQKDDFAGYNLLLGDGASLWYASNRITEPIHLEPGIYGLSNHLLDTPWPKVKKGKAALVELIKHGQLNNDAAFAILTDTTLAADADLPDTGIPYAWEKALSAIFISMPEYGTRCSTLLTFNGDRQYHLAERRYHNSPDHWDESEFCWST